MPLAYLITWTTYGTWLHGDGRGSVDDAHNKFGKPRAAPDPARLAAQRGALAGEPFTLTAASRRVVQDTIRRHCAVRKWMLLELNVRTNHVHAVVSAPVDPDRVLSQFKSWWTRLLRENGLAGPRQSVWTEGGSTRYLWDDASVARAREYVRDEQGPEI